MSASFVLPAVILPDSESSMPSNLLIETAYLEQRGVGRTLCPVYRSIEVVMRELEEKVGFFDNVSQLQPLQKRLVDIEANHKKDGVWGERLEVCLHSHTLAYSPASPHTEYRLSDALTSLCVSCCDCFSQDGSIPTGQGALNDLLERAHALENEIVQRTPDH
jgi:hypothetical protein